jgi:predicted alpha/beta superfamily hydrolase
MRHGGSSATRRVLKAVHSPQLGNERDIDVFLPPSYARTRRRYPVVYMQDGQNLADPDRAFAGTWNLPEAIAELSSRGIEAIIVGIPNMGAERVREYSPFHDERHGGGSGDAYLAFVERTIKPLVDERFRTRPEREAAGLFGSSMGGLISLYAFFRASEAFGFAGAMSPSLWFGGRALLKYVEKDGAPSGRIYLDAGTEEGMSTMHDAEHFARELLRKGYRSGDSFLFTQAYGGRHEEAHWSMRLVPALEFLLRPVAKRRRR